MRKSKSMTDLGALGSNNVQQTQQPTTSQSLPVSPENISSGMPNLNYLINLGRLDRLDGDDIASNPLEGISGISFSEIYPFDFNMWTIIAGQMPQMHRQLDTDNKDDEKTEHKDENDVNSQTGQSAGDGNDDRQVNNNSIGFFQPVQHDNNGLATLNKIDKLIELCDIELSK